MSSFPLNGNYDLSIRSNLHKIANEQFVAVSEDEARRLKSKAKQAAQCIHCSRCVSKSSISELKTHLIMCAAFQKTYIGKSTIGKLV